MNGSRNASVEGGCVAAVTDEHPFRRRADEAGCCAVRDLDAASGIAARDLARSLVPAVRVPAGAGRTRQTRGEQPRIVAAVRTPPPVGCGGRIRRRRARRRSRRESVEAGASRRYGRWRMQLLSWLDACVSPVFGLVLVGFDAPTRRARAVSPAAGIRRGRPAVDPGSTSHGGPVSWWSVRGGAALTSYIIVSNHQSMFDIPSASPPFLLHPSEVHSKRSLGSWIQSYNLREGGHVLIDRPMPPDAIRTRSRPRRAKPPRCSRNAGSSGRARPIQTGGHPGPPREGARAPVVAAD
jgi:hypothetical protein